NETALGTGTPSANTTTTVESGAALEVGALLPDVNGGIQRGMQISNTKLVLNGTGNALYDPAPLMILSGDNLWRGPIVDNASVTIEFKGPAASTLLPTIIPTTTSSSGTVTDATSTPGRPGISNVAGINHIETLTFNGLANGDNFNLLVGNGIALTTTTASFNQPAVGASVAVQMTDTSWMSVGQKVFIAGGGYYTVASIFNGT